MNSPIFLSMLAIILIGGCVQQPLATQEQSPAPKNGLGALCSGDECNIFCKDNLGRCKEYCQRNPANALCQKSFGFESKYGIVETANKTETKPQASNPVYGTGCVSNTKPVFTKPFTDLSKINHMTPIGNIKAGSLSRSYVFVKKDGSGTSLLAPLYAPSNSTLFGIVYAYRGDKSKGARAEYRLDFRASCEVIFAFDHIAQISGRLKQFAPEVPADSTQRDKEIYVPVTAGELLGYTDGGLAGGSWDFLLFNYAKEVPHINPARWTSDHNKYADCPYDYFTEDLRKQYYSMFASAGGERAPSTCRSASRDVAGTLAGGWFKGNSTDTQGSRLYLGSDFSTVDLVMDEGNPLATGSVLSIRHQNAQIKPEDVKVGQSVCYSEGASHAFLKLLTETQMAADIGPGACPPNLPASPDIWER